MENLRAYQMVKLTTILNMWALKQYTLVTLGMYWMALTQLLARIMDSGHLHHLASQVYLEACIGFSFHHRAKFFSVHP